MKLLLVEDEKMIAEPLAALLQKHNYSVDMAYDGEYGLDCALSGIYDIIVLDIMLPKKSGLDILREIRKARLPVLVIMLTARGEPEHKIYGLDQGADDYLTKPFLAEELLARLRALQRRGGEFHNDGVLSFADISLNPHKLTISSADKDVALTLKESQLLEMLILRRPRVVSKESIIEKLWGYDSDAEGRHVDTHMSLLRGKLKQLRSCVCIKTIRGYGYLLYEQEG